MKILIACEESQRVCTAFRNKGHEAYSCDILDCSGGHPEWHIQGDVLPLINGNCTFTTMDGKEHAIETTWDLIIAHPPCTHLAVSGARHFEKKRANGSQREAIEFFCKLLNANCSKIVVENPVNIISGDYIKQYFPDLCEKYRLPIKSSQVIQPYEYGNPSKKSTCLWIKGLPNLVPTNIVEPDLITYTCKDGKKVTFSRDYCQGVGKDRGNRRSKTFEGIARAMADQWG
jgi:site-specific DNA-cytosine methylase